MFRIIKDIYDDYKMLFLKLGIALGFIFMLVQYNSYGKRSNAHFLLLQIKNGNVDEVCIAPSFNIKTDDDFNIYALVEDRRIYLGPGWDSLTPRNNLYVAIATKSKGGIKRAYEVDGRNARILLQEYETDTVEGCKSYNTQERKKLVN